MKSPQSICRAWHKPSGLGRLHDRQSSLGLKEPRTYHCSSECNQEPQNLYVLALSLFLCFFPYFSYRVSTRFNVQLQGFPKMCSQTLYVSCPNCPRSWPFVCVSYLTTATELQPSSTYNFKVFQKCLVKYFIFPQTVIDRVLRFEKISMKQLNIHGLVHIIRLF